MSTVAQLIGAWSVEARDRDAAAADEIEGLARELVKAVQGMRRDAGLAVSDRIQLTWDTEDADLVAALEVDPQLCDDRDPSTDDACLPDTGGPVAGPDEAVDVNSRDAWQGQGHSLGREKPC